MDGHPRQDPAYRPATERPRKRGLFYGPDSPATRQARPAAALTAVSVEPLGAVARRGLPGRAGYEPLRESNPNTTSGATAGAGDPSS